MVWNTLEEIKNSTEFSKISAQYPENSITQPDKKPFYEITPVNEDPKELACCARLLLEKMNDDFQASREILDYRLSYVIESKKVFT